MRSSRLVDESSGYGLDSLTASTKVATVLCLIQTSSDTVDSEERQVKQCWIQIFKNRKNSPLKFYFLLGRVRWRGRSSTLLWLCGSWGGSWWTPPPPSHPRTPHCWIWTVFSVLGQKRGWPLFRGSKVLQLNLDSFWDYVQIWSAVIGHL